MDAAGALGGRGKRVRDLTGAVGGVVVYDQQVYGDRLLLDFFGDLLDVAGLIVGRDDHDYAGFRVF